MKLLKFTIGAVLIGISFNSCIKRNYDNPPDSSKIDVKVPVNATISDINGIAANMQSGQYRTLGDTTIYGIVSADDRSGNFYKQVIIQDSTGGIVLSLAQTNLYNDYPIGRKVFVKLKGLTLLNYKGLPEIGLSASATGGSVSLTGIPSALINTFVVKGSYPNEVVPIKVRMSDLFGNANRYLNRLVEIQNIQFDSLSANVPFAGSVSSGAIGTSRLIKDCPYTGSMVMYNSAYAWFQAALTPRGKGTVTGIFSIYNTPQFLIRDSTDVKLTEPRSCP